MFGYPTWKIIATFIVVFVLGVYALPNLWPSVPTLQIAVQGNPAVADLQSLESIISKRLEDDGIQPTFQQIVQSRNSLEMDFEDVGQQVRARKLAEEVRFPYPRTVSLNFRNRTPELLKRVQATPLTLGLDLRGGLEFLLEVHTDFIFESRIRAAVQSTTLPVDQGSMKFSEVLGEPAIRVTLPPTVDRNVISRTLMSENDWLQVVPDPNSVTALIARVTGAEETNVTNQALLRNLTTLRNRVNSLGVSEPVVRRQGANRILVQLPGIQDSARAKRLIGETATLAFHMVYETADSEGTPVRTISRPYRRESGETVASRQRLTLEEQVIVRGENVLQARASFDDTGAAVVPIELDAEGGARMALTTQENLGRRMAVLLIRQVPQVQTVRMSDGRTETRERFREVSEIISTPRIAAVFGARFQIEGIGAFNEAQDLALLLRSGSLAAPMFFVEEQIIEPTLGAENIRVGVLSLAIGTLLVIIAMLVIYKAMGVLAIFALATNLVLLTAILSIVGATLTLPGIAGIVLTMGMAVDANTLIFSRIREFLRANYRLQRAIAEGYDRAWITIFDANLTTFLVAVVLFAVGTGPVRGFAVTLMIGIVTSVFSATLFSRSVLSFIIPYVRKIRI